jgi:hypothetical protein
MTPDASGSDGMPPSGDWKIPDGVGNDGRAAGVPFDGAGLPNGESGAGASGATVGAWRPDGDSPLSLMITVGADSDTGAGGVAALPFVCSSTLGASGAGASDGAAKAGAGVADGAGCEGASGTGVGTNVGVSADAAGALLSGSGSAKPTSSTCCKIRISHFRDCNQWAED